MRWVEQAVIRPHRCAVLPFVGNATTNKGFIDTGSELEGHQNHVYVSVEAVEEMARQIHWLPPVAVQQYVADMNHMATELASLREQLAEAERELDAVHTLKSRGWDQGARPVRTPARKVTKEVG